MSLALSSNDAEVISRVHDLDIDELKCASSAEELEELYEIQKSIDYINKNGSTKVALQFPDYLLQDSVKVVQELTSKTDADVFLLADTTYGSYDVDEVAASHIDADLIIHYGKSAFTSTSKIDTLFVFGKLAVGLNHVLSSFNAKYSDSTTPVVILLELNCYHLSDALREALAEHEVIVADINQADIRSNTAEACLRNCPNCDCKENEPSPDEQVVTKAENIEDIIPSDENLFDFPLDDGENGDFKGQKVGFYRIPTETPVEEMSMFFVGCKESETLHNVILQRPSLSGYVYDVRSHRCTELPNFVKRKLNKRYFIVEKVRDAKRIGILVGTMGMAGYQKIIRHLKQIIKQSGRQSYTIVVGKPNPAKLANFAEMDVFVLVACPEQSFVDEPRDYFKSIATPYEVEVALNKNREWSSKYITDFRELLLGGSQYVKFEADLSSDISLIDGSLRDFSSHSSRTESSDDNTVALTSEEKALELFHPFSSANFYANRSWRGLEQNLGKTPVRTAQPGRDGVPTKYTNITS